MSLFRALLKKQSPPVFEFYFTITVSNAAGSYTYNIGYTQGTAGSISQNPFYIRKDLYFNITALRTNVITGKHESSVFYLVINRESTLTKNKTVKLTRLDNGVSVSGRVLNLNVSITSLSTQLLSYGDSNKTISFKLEFV